MGVIAEGRIYTWRLGEEQLHLPTPQRTVVHLLESATLNDEGNFPLKLADKERVRLQLHNAWKEMSKQASQPQILVVDFTAIGEIPPELVKEVLAYNHCAFVGIPNPMFAVYDQLRPAAYQALATGFDETSQVVAARPAGLAYARLMGCERLVREFDVRYGMLANELSWSDGFAFSREIYGKRNTYILDQMNRLGLVMRLDLPNRRQLYRAVQ